MSEEGNEGIDKAGEIAGELGGIVLKAGTAEVLIEAIQKMSDDKRDSLVRAIKAAGY